MLFFITHWEQCNNIQIIVNSTLTKNGNCVKCLSKWILWIMFLFFGLIWLWKWRVIRLFFPPYNNAETKASKEKQHRFLLQSATNHHIRSQWNITFKIKFLLNGKVAPMWCITKRWCYQNYLDHRKLPKFHIKWIATHTNGFFAFEKKTPNFVNQ